LLLDLNFRAQITISQRRRCRFFQAQSPASLNWERIQRAKRGGFVSEGGTSQGNPAVSSLTFAELSRIKFCKATNPSFLMISRLRGALSTILIPLRKRGRVALLFNKTKCNSPKQRSNEPAWCFISELIKTITKFSNVIGYQQPDLNINHTNYNFLKCDWCINCCILL